MKVVRPRTSTELASVTVVVPCYNYGRFLSQVAGSVLSQERVNARVIIVDDASTDDSAAIAQQLAAADARIEVVIHAENQGRIRTYNDGLQRVVTAYAALLSADDLLVPGALARATDLMTCRPEVGMVYGQPSPSPTRERRTSRWFWRQLDRLAGPGVDRLGRTPGALFYPLPGSCYAN